ncbi:HNH endonuclease family protein [Streptomyces sp. NPDC059875]|uniref:HNH endonuclease family protein n=1 Tax=unclassified Streptomyces TaxID=2593676 RepID=UPI00364E59B4
MPSYPKTLPLAALAAAVLITSGCTAGPDGSPAEGAPGGGGPALAAVDTLTVKGRAPKTGYEREKFGRAWVDVDGNGCGTRDDILKRDLSDVRLKDGRCKVASGVLADDPYTGDRVAFVRGRSKVDIDHLVALSDAWQKGAQQWDAEKRRRFANDPLNLLAVDASANRRKSDGDAATWLPPNKAYRCTYVAAQVAVKKKYGVWVTRGERDAMKKVLGGCPDQKLP